MCKVEMPLFPFVKLKFAVYGRKQTDIHTYTRVSQCSHTSVGLTQARPNNILHSLVQGQIWNVLVCVEVR